MVGQSLKVEKIKGWKNIDWIRSFLDHNAAISAIIDVVTVSKTSLTAKAMAFGTNL